MTRCPQPFPKLPPARYTQVWLLITPKAVVHLAAGVVPRGVRRQAQRLAASLDLHWQPKRSPA
jgi:hypothetical protein